jgi:hypothetical protein
LMGCFLSFLPGKYMMLGFHHVNDINGRCERGI